MLGFSFRELMAGKIRMGETMRAMRSISSFERLPIIAITAKAMRGDREKSIAAGASDYVAKPVDTGQLLSLLQTSCGSFEKVSPSSR